jgi:predicted nucleotidyltransferase
VVSFTKDDILSVVSELKPIYEKDGIILHGLFGSYAKGNETLYSDIDIAISKKKDILDKNSIYHYFDVVNRLKSDMKHHFHRGIDVFDLDSSSELKKTIENELIYV